MVALIVGAIVVSSIIAVIVRLSTVAVGAAFGRKIDSLHRDTELVLCCRRVPDAWTLHDRRRIEGARARGASIRKIESIKSAAKAAYAKRLQEHIEYFRRTQTVADEFTRETLLSRLGSVFSEWESLSWDEMTSDCGRA